MKKCNSCGDESELYELRILMGGNIEHRSRAAACHACENPLRKA